MCLTCSTQTQACLNELGADQVHTSMSKVDLKSSYLLVLRRSWLGSRPFPQGRIRILAVSSLLQAHLPTKQSSALLAGWRSREISKTLSPASARPPVQFWTQFGYTKVSGSTQSLRVCNPARLAKYGYIQGAIAIMPYPQGGHDKVYIKKIVGINGDSIW